MGYHDSGKLNGPDPNEVYEIGFKEGFAAGQRAIDEAVNQISSEARVDVGIVPGSAPPRYRAIVESLNKYGVLMAKERVRGEGWTRVAAIMDACKIVKEASDAQ